MNSLKICILTALIVLAGTVPVAGQEIVLSGTVTDATDAVLPGATVTATHVDSGNTFVAVADQSGQYRIGAMRPGVYRVSVELSGFSTVTRENLELLVGQRVAVNFRLTVSSLQETVTVTGQSPLVDVTQSKLGGNVDSRQLSELPVNGRNWLDLTMLAPGSRVNAVGEAPIGTHAGQFQLNLDGQQVSNMMACARWGQPKFSRDAIGEFEFVSSRFDATQGRSIGVQVNAVTKAGTNNYTGTLSGYFRDDKFNAADPIVKRVLPYSNQQVSATFGGPFKKDRAHFFGYYEGEREPQSYFFNSQYRRFNIADLTGTRTENKVGARFDNQLNQSTRLMVRGNGWKFWQPYTDAAAGGSTGGSTLHPSRASSKRLDSAQVYATLTKMFGNRMLNEFKPGYNYITSKDLQVVESPQISLIGYTIGQEVFKPLFLTEKTWSLRNDFTLLAGHHEMKMGAEYLHLRNILFWPSNKFGSLDALGGPPPANLEDLFPVWNDPSTWNLAALSRISRTWTQSVSNANYTIDRPRHDYGFWFQENWSTTSKLTLNLGLRWDLAFNGVGEDIDFPPFRSPQPHEWDNVQPRLGFAYSVTNTTVLRGGWGIYYQGMTDQPAHHSRIDLITVAPVVLYDGRPDFASNPFQGRQLTFEDALKLAGRRSTTGIIASPDLDTPYAYQTSIGMQRQIGRDMSVQADYVWTASRHEMTIRNINLTYNPATGANYPFTDISRLPFPTWRNVSMRFSDDASNYHGLETAFTKRFSDHWQLSGTYTLSGTWDFEQPPLNPGCEYPMTAPGVCNVPITLAPDFAARGVYYLTGAQRHRAVVNGIWSLPFDVQVSGLYFFGDGGKVTTNSGRDVRQLGGGGGRLRPDGTVIPYNNFDRPAIHRVDLRIQKRLRLASRTTADGIFEVFNVFNHANYAGFNTNEASGTFRQPIRDTNVAYAPRTLQLGFRLAF